MNLHKKNDPINLFRLLPSFFPCSNSFSNRCIWKPFGKTGISYKWRNDLILCIAKPCFSAVILYIFLVTMDFQKSKKKKRKLKHQKSGWTRNSDSSCTRRWKWSASSASTKLANCYSFAKLQRSNWNWNWSTASPVTEVSRMSTENRMN